MDGDTTRVVTRTYREAHQFVSQAAPPMLTNPVLPSQTVNQWHQGIFDIYSIDRAILRLRQQGLLHQTPAVTQEAESRSMELLDYGKYLSLRPPGEPEQD